MTGDISKKEWQTRRVTFNHGWLKNVYLNRLQECEQRLAMRDPDLQRVMRFLREDFHQWSDHRIEAMKLVESFTVEMSPRNLFATPPLSHLGMQTRAWLADVIHAFWVQRHAVESKLNRVLSAVERVQTLYDTIDALMGSRGPDELVRDVELRTKMKEYSGACVDLTESLSLLPKEILIT